MSATYEKLLDRTADTKRSTLSGGKFGAPATYLTGVKCTRPTPLDPEIRQRLTLDTPHELLEVFTEAADIQEGHTLVVPKDHARDVWDIEPEQAEAVMRSALKIARALKTAYDCDGVNLFQSNGAAAGQVVFHFHMHVVPRWSGRRVFLLQREEHPATAPFEKVAERIRTALDDLTG